MKKIAIVSTRLGGIDGVSIEASKWAKAYRKLGMEVVFIAGDFFGKDSTPDSFKVKGLDYYEQEILDIRKESFPKENKNQNLQSGFYKKIERSKDDIKKRLVDIILDQKIDYLSIENALAIPLNIPLGIALTEIVIEMGIRSITRHHDFFWERDEFQHSNVVDILDRYFPPDILDLTHVVINTVAKRSLIEKKDIKPFYIPNIFDFGLLDGLKDRRYEVRDFLGIGRDQYLFLQPTRIIKRKNIERSIELVAGVSERLDEKVTLFISGRPEEDEIAYFYKTVDLAKERRINLILNEDYTCNTNTFTGKKVFDKFSIYDIYNGCDFVTLPSDIEGFGNPVIESSVFKRPLFVNHYPVLDDMLEKGFDFVVIEKQVTSATIDKVIRLLGEKRFRQEILDKNFDIAKKYYSIEYLVEKLGKIFGIS